MTRVLTIEDEPDLQRLIEFNLQAAGHQVSCARTGRDGLRLAEAEMPDLVLLDLMLPDVTGLEVCRRLQANQQTARIPVIMLTAKSEEADRIAGLELGAQDYIVKPFNVRELVLRVAVAIGRAQRRATEEHADSQTFGVLRIDRLARKTWVHDQTVALTAIEFDLLSTLLARKNRVQDRDTLLDLVWGQSSDVTLRAVDTQVKRLREKLGAAGDYIETVRGVGYRFAENP